MVLDVGLEVLVIFGPGLITTVLVKLIMSKLLLFLGGFSSFGVSLSLPHQENKMFLPRFGTVLVARGELGFSRFEFNGWLRF